MLGMNRGPIRILHVLDSLGNGGLENGVLNLIQHMDSRQFEHSICTVRAQGVNASRTPAGRTQLLHLGKREGSRFQLREITSAIRENQPDVVHSRNWGAIEAVIATRLGGRCKVVHSEHGFEAGVSTREPFRRRAFRWLAFHMADRVFCVSKQLRDFHARQTRFSAQRIIVIHNGVDSQRFHPDTDARSRIRREFGIGEDEFCIGCVGNLLPVKDHRTLLEALLRLGEATNAWHLLIAGEGPERRNLEEIASVLSTRMRISLPGAVNNVPELLNAFDVYVLPSANEGISNSLLEAMATALPVIVSEVGGNTEVVEDSMSGLLFPVGDRTRLGEHLLRLQERRRWRRELGEAARLRVREQFSIDSMVQNYEHLYRCVLAAKIPGPVEVQV